MRSDEGQQSTRSSTSQFQNARFCNWRTFNSVQVCRRTQMGWSVLKLRAADVNGW